MNTNEIKSFDSNSLDDYNEDVNWPGYYREVEKAKERANGRKTLAGVVFLIVLMVITVYLSPVFQVPEGN